MVRAVQVEDQRRLAIHLPQRLDRHAVALPAIVQRMERPPVVAQIEPPHQAGDERRRQRRAVIVARPSSARTACARGLRRSKPRSLEPHHVLQGDEDNAADGHLAHGAEDDDLLTSRGSACRSPSAFDIQRCRFGLQQRLMLQLLLQPPLHRASLDVVELAEQPVHRQQFLLRAGLHDPAWLITTIRLTLRSVDRRCATRNVVRPVISRSSASRITASVRESIDDVGSSRMRIGASFRNARATAMR